MIGAHDPFVKIPFLSSADDFLYSPENLSKRIFWRDYPKNRKEVFSTLFLGLMARLAQHAKLVIWIIPRVGLSAIQVVMNVKLRFAIVA